MDAERGGEAGLGAGERDQRVAGGGADSLADAVDGDDRADRRRSSCWRRPARPCRPPRARSRRPSSPCGAASDPRRSRWRPGPAPRRRGRCRRSRPSTSGLAPSVKTRYSGSTVATISAETSVSMLTTPSSTTFRGTRRRDGLRAQSRGFSSAFEVSTWYTCLQVLPARRAIRPQRSNGRASPFLALLAPVQAARRCGRRAGLGVPGRESRSETSAATCSAKPITESPFSSWG